MPGGAGTGEQPMVRQGLLPSSVREQQGLGCSIESDRGEAKCNTSTHTGDNPQLTHRTLVTGSLGSPGEEKMNQDQEPQWRGKRRQSAGCRARDKLAAAWV